MKDYYSTLEIDRGASDAELKKAYRKLALRYHPDRNPGDKESEHKFKEINEAYSCLSDPGKKSNYDTFGTAEGGAGMGGFGFSDFGGDFGDVFGNIFGDIFESFTGKTRAQPTRGDDLRYDLEMSLFEAATGIEEVITVPRWETCSKCNGTGAKDRNLTTCDSCKGMGSTRFQHGFFSISKTCGKCNGTGKTITDPCPDCKSRGKVRNERSVSVNVPAGVDTGIRLRVRGEGEAGTLGGPYGDLFVVILVKEHPFFKREGTDLFCSVPVSFTQAALGSEIEVPTLDGKETIKIPTGTPSGKIFQIKNKGVPKLGAFRKGSLFVAVNVDVPKKLSKRQKELLKEFAHISEDDVSKSFMSKIKNMFAKEQAK